MQVLSRGEVMESSSEEQTLEFATRLGGTLSAGDTVLLRGEIGAGKSVFARGVSRALGVSEWQGSPTFTLVNEYESTPPLFHADLYRLSVPEVEDLGLEEYAQAPGVLLIEWADRAAQYLGRLSSRPPIWVDLWPMSERARRIRVHAATREPPAFDFP
ncbi:MAG TPA: tRNA (adenosine(37)-N6)-threonylcarbamoyltransferase complex ATPase subunit type 1 TsaE [Chloroflexota bacterium]|nr:tRNA (adenosine(37)-N6)-threonylcarbamoyltransferase complex ATPase subunit type 1 TsaE [Chloroflexota bacterium]